MIAAGIGIGTVISLTGARVLASFLVGVSPSDPLTFGGILLLLPSVTLVTQGCQRIHAGGAVGGHQARHE
jgi:hypothetical protein